MDTLDGLIKRSALSYQEVADGLEISRSTLHIWRSKNEVPPGRIADVANLLDIHEESIPTLVARTPSAETGYASLHALSDKFIAELGNYPATSDQITLLGLAGVYPIEQLPLFKERTALAVAEGSLSVRVLIANPNSEYAIARAAEEGHTAESYAERVGFAVDKWGQVLGSAAGESIRFYDFWPAAMVYQFGDHGVLAMPHLPYTGGYDLPAVWHSGQSPAFKPYAEFLNRAWELAKPTD